MSAAGQTEFKPIRKGDFVVAHETSWTSRLGATGYAVEKWRLARASRCTRDGQVKEYQRVNHWPDGVGIPRRPGQVVYAIGKEHTQTLIDATADAGDDWNAFTWRDKREAESAIVGMLGITKSPDSELTKRLPADYHLRFN